MKYKLRYRLFLLLFSHFDNYDEMKKITKNKKIKTYLKIILKNPIKVIKVLIGRYFIADYLEIPLTTICTLKCKNCSALMDYYTKGENVDLNKNIMALKRFTDSIDLLIHLRLLGGEPLCYPNLYDILLYLSKENKIKRVTIVTNGTLLFNDERVLKILKESKFDIHISNYGEVSKNKYKLVKQLEEHNIKYYLKDENSMWRDYGNLECRNRNEVELKKQYSNCKLNCNSLFYGVLHHCPRSSHGINLKKIPFRKQDCLDLLDTEITNKQLRKDLYKFYYKKVDYIEACNYCNNGTNAIKEIPAGIQCKK